MTQHSLPKLNFPPIKMRARAASDSLAVWDAIRKTYILLTPEEWVRQHLVAFLTTQMAIPAPCICLEYPVLLNNQNQRADLVALSRNRTPLILAECKAPEVPISQATLDQAVRYNSIIKARYIILTNGLSHFIYEREGLEGEYKALKEFSQIEL